VDIWTIGTLLDTVSGYLREQGSASARLDAELLLAEALRTDRIRLYTEYDRPLTPAELDRYRALVGRRARHEPVAYILGRAHFRHLSLEVGPAVLIPRPETEELVEAALQSLRLRPIWEALAAPAATAPGASETPSGIPSAARPSVWARTPSADSVAPGVDPATATGTAPGTAPGSSPGRGAVTTDAMATRAAFVADVGTGSGAIALSLAQEAGLSILAIDASDEALAVAARNRAALGLEELVELRHSDLLNGIAADSLGLVVSNPPYVKSGDMDELAPDIRLYEPVPALEGGEDGLAVFRRLLPQAARVLRPGGTVLLEVGDGQAPAVTGLAREAGFSLIEVHSDLSGKERIVAATRPGTFTVPLDGLDGRQSTALAAALGGGAVIGIPTDTVYGIAARWDSRAGVQRLFAAKGRGSHQPVAVIFPSVASVASSLPDLDGASARVMRALLPGPYTFVVATSVSRPPRVGTDDSLGVRVPGDPALLEFLASLGTPLAATSANLSGQTEARAAAEVEPSVLAYCSIALTASERIPDAGPPAASTVIDLRPLAAGALPLVLREGAAGGAETLRRISALW